MSLAQQLLLPTADDDPSYRAAMQVYYKCDESSGDLLDYFGNCNLTDTNTVGSAAGNVGTARDFVPGSSEYFTRAHHANLAVSGVGAWSVVLAFRPDDVSAVRCLWNKGSGTGGGDAEYSMLIDNTASLRSTALNAGSIIGNAQTSAGVLSTATWYFVRTWFDPTASTHGTIYVRVNESNEASANLSMAWNAQTRNFNVGVQNNASLAFYYDGRIDEFAKFNRVLTAAEATELYSRFQTNRAIL